MLTNGNIVFARRTGASEITPEKKIVWNYDAPEGTEVHTAQPIGKDKVLIMQNGNPAKLKLISKKSGQVEKELTLPTRDPNHVHGQFRHIRMTKAGTFLVAHLDLGKVVEYSKDGKELWSVPAPSAWAAVRLKNGNTLITQRVNEWAGPIDKGSAPIQAIELTPEKKVVWVLRSWTPPADLGPSTTIQILDN